jgi:transposase
MEEAVAGYKVFNGGTFRYMKTLVLERRPVYHKTDMRIRAHVFLHVGD